MDVDKRLGLRVAAQVLLNIRAILKRAPFRLLVRVRDLHL
tara:strand:- start:126 stop:245 length:120 start_codon:yes stop_codon:yes gene_type:complete